MKHMKQITAAGLSVVLVGTLSFPALAADAPDEKQEVVYVMADAAGKVNDIEVVNIFKGGEITDYGDYSAVKILNTTDEINQKNDKINISSSADKVYYQGTMNENEIPWNISIRYFMDGKEYSASEIDGKSGKLKIKFAVSKNENYEGRFYEEYALQAAFTLDTDKCTEIVADGAALANVGTDKQISYTILPGRGIDTEIEANVTDFEVSAVSINGIKLNLNMEIDNEELMGQVTELMDATKKLNDGASQLHDGTGTLKEGSGALASGAESLNGGVQELDSGISALQNGVGTMQTGLNLLSDKSNTLTSGSGEMKAALETLQTSLNQVSVSAEQLALLTESSAAVKQGIEGVYNGVVTLQNNLGYEQYKAVMAQNGLTIDDVIAGNNSVLGCVQKYEDLLNRISEECPDAASIIDAYRPELTYVSSQMGTLAQGNNGAIMGMEAYLNGVSAGVSDLSAGVSELNTKYAEFDAGIAAAVNTLEGMLVNMSDLKNGVNMLVEKYTELDAGVAEYTNGVSQIAAGYNGITDGVSALAAGNKKLLEGAAALKTGTSELYNGTVSLNDGAGELADGTNLLYTSTSGMDTQLQEKIDEILASIGGDETETVSFVSDKNTNVDSVQFVIKTDAVEEAETEVEESTEPENQNFGQKLLNLFKGKK